MKFLLYEEFKHKGERVFKDIIYHKANPKFRDKIDKEGLKCMKGDSYSAHSPEESEIPAIFGYFSETDPYDSTYDDDIWIINANKKMKWYKDLEMGDDTSVVTYDNIPRNCIELKYKGTGKSEF
jgi:hypothetical protein